MKPLIGVGYGGDFGDLVDLITNEPCGFDFTFDAKEYAINVIAENYRLVNFSKGSNKPFIHKTITSSLKKGLCKRNPMLGIVNYEVDYLHTYTDEFEVVDHLSEELIDYPSWHIIGNFREGASYSYRELYSHPNGCDFYESHNDIFKELLFYCESNGSLVILKSTKVCEWANPCVQTLRIGGYGRDYSCIDLNNEKPFNIEEDNYESIIRSYAPWDELWDICL